MAGDLIHVHLGTKGTPGQDFEATVEITGGTLDWRERVASAIRAIDKDEARFALPIRHDAPEVEDSRRVLTTTPALVRVEDGALLCWIEDGRGWFIEPRTTNLVVLRPQRSPHYTRRARDA